MDLWVILAHCIKEKKKFKMDNWHSRLGCARCWTLNFNLEEIKTWSPPATTHIAIPWRLEIKGAFWSVYITHFWNSWSCGLCWQPQLSWWTSILNTYRWNKRPFRDPGKKKSHSALTDRWLYGDTNLGLKSRQCISAAGSLLGGLGSQNAPSTLWHRSHPVFRRCLWFHFLLFSAALCELPNV